MSPAAGVMASSNSVEAAPMKISTTKVTQQPAPVPTASESFAKDAILAWFRGEFAAANAIIDALCSHLAQADGGSSEYRSVFSAIHRRRLNWIPVLQMQKYYSIADVAAELRKVAEKMINNREDIQTASKIEEINVPGNENNKSEDACQEEDAKEINEIDEGEVLDEDSNRDESSESDITDAGSHEVRPIFENIRSNHADCKARLNEMKITKGFVAKELMKGRMVNVVRGLKLYEDVFTDVELSKLTEFVNELRATGQNGKLPGETFILYNQQSKASKRELIQLGAPIFGQIKEETTKESTDSHIEPIPALLHRVIDHLVEWHLISENRRPNSCIINFFDEGESSQPFLKPPHLDQPILMLVLSESIMAFGRTLVSDIDGNYKGPLMLSLKEGSLLVMRGYSADMARHVMCSSPNKRVSIIFFKVRTEAQNVLSTIPSLSGAMTLWQPHSPTAYTVPNGLPNGHGPIDVIPRWGVLRAPVIMLSPVVRPAPVSPRSITNSGTGVFLPWTVGSRKPAKHLPPRARKARLLALPPPVETHDGEA